MDERLEQLEKLFDTLKTCTHRIDESGLRVDERAYLFVVHGIGLFLLNVGTRDFANREAWLNHWVKQGPIKTERLLTNLKRQGQGAITFQDVEAFFDTPDPPEKPNPRAFRR